VDFEWDDKKALKNLSKHEIAFTEALSVWLDSNALEIPDPDHSENEERWIRLGFSNKLRLIVAVYVEKIEGKKIRLISARKAVKDEEQEYFKRNK